MAESVTPEPTTPAPTGGETTPPAPTPSGGDVLKFTQADLDRLIGERLARESKKYADYDQLKVDAVEYKKLKDAQLTDQQKKDAELDGLKAKLQEATTTAEQQRVIIQERLIRAEVTTIATGLGFRDPGDAWKLVDLADVKIGDDYTVDTKAVKLALEKLAKDKPYLVGGSAAPHGTPQRATVPGAPAQPAPASEQKTYTSF
jgi:hypothetical protein